ncbi:MAG: SUMF1/EgtB/PvdO family nonheme iron enzyme [Opitutaceae bacterium]|nr:SUMF1/EgtB/PvdO family nonheme iron enzyme [Opitutaceae bacterium]
MKTSVLTFRAKSVFMIAAAMLAAGVVRGAASAAKAGNSFTQAAARIAEADLVALRLAIEDLTASFGERYPRGAAYLAELRKLEEREAAVRRACTQRDASAPAQATEFVAAVTRLRMEALLANPLLDFDRLLFVRRESKKPIDYNLRQQPSNEIGMPCNHWCNASLPRGIYNNEIAVLSPVRPGGKVTSLHRPTDGGYVGEIDLRFEGDRMLFAQCDATNWKIFEMNADGSGRRQVSRMPDDVDAFDPCYLPDGRIIFGSTANYQAVPCWSGIPHRVANLYQMDANGGNVRQLCFDQDHDLYPTVRSDGQVMYSRWDYTGIRHEYLRILMTMNPDGTGQRALYGSNSWWPNALYFARSIPGDPDKFVGIVSDYHGVPRMGWLAVFDTAKGWNEADGVVQRIPGRGKKVEAVIVEKLVIGTWPLFLHPYPLSEKYFLVSCRPSADHNWGIYLVDVFDNMVPIREEEGWALLEPIPVRRTPKPPVIPDHVDVADNEATIYLHDVYTGQGLKGVPRGTIRALRLFSYHFGYPGLAGGSRIGIGGPWEVNRILGTVPVEPDGSALFRVPANTPISLQPIDAEGKAVQVMRSWYTAMPGEKVSCIGCHERTGDTPPVALAHQIRSGPKPATTAASPRAGAGHYASLAAIRVPSEITPWYGPARGFDFEREVQPVLDRYCIDCHNGGARDDGMKIADLRARKFQPAYRGWPIGQVEPMGVIKPATDIQRIEKVIDRKGAHKDLPVGRLFFTPAYEALFPLVRRVDIEDAPDLPVPGEYHADTSRLIQLLQAGHHGVRLDPESWDRLITWIDLNAPCHGTWSEVYAIPGDANVRRMELRTLYGGPTVDPELGAKTLKPAVLAAPAVPRATVVGQPAVIAAAKWTIDPVEARRRQAADGLVEKVVSFGRGGSLKLVRIPAGTFVMGEAAAPTEELAAKPVAIAKSFWMSAGEITNRQFQGFDPAHDSGWSRDFRFRLPVTGRQGRALNEPDQPVVRVSWTRAVEFCRWLSQQTGLRITLPTEAQWEYACRAGSDSAYSFGDTTADFSVFANLADDQLWGLGDRRFNDGAIVTTTVGHYRPNAWGLHDMHGNAAEWTATGSRGRRVVRGGSFYDGPVAARSAARLAYPEWQRVHNVGFRIVGEVSERADAVATAVPMAGERSPVSK